MPFSVLPLCQLRIEPVGLGDCGLEVVDDQRPGHPAKVPEGILQAADELLGCLAINHLAVALAGMTQDDAEDVRLAPPGFHTRR
jgi:hypothetical protein